MEGTKQVAQRIVNAEENFADTVQEITGCTRDEAFKALVTMRKLRVVKLDPIGGRYNVTHGIYLERDVLRNAIAY
ncbi:MULTISPECIES: hypothetical protein [Cupriavidus]|jgi:DNA-binding IclR family transcriptional regulator|uniref:hypothetical protein n=1 Tax=Cupriavidus TaxID=106589 RepID=UPI0004638BBE|nr:hypothetical protein [Cupriavidus metallidurans]AVA38317.1 hypothetical protein C3Z06_32450 [Cupriavidus metallidurans]KWW32319.1 hypothetical protein AU374_05919 [Cupriavidus metallidurans]